MTTFFTSDTHFSHARIIELSDRPFKDINHMDEEIIRRWNEKVKPEDTVYHLGDVALGPIADSLPKVGRLNGTKILVIGNHDRVFDPTSKMKPEKAERWDTEYRKVFDIIVDATSVELDDNAWALLSHFPYDGDSHDGDRYKSSRLYDAGLPLIHGHTHLDKRISRSAKGTLQVHVGMDAWNYAPVSEETVFGIIRDHS